MKPVFIISIIAVIFLTGIVLSINVSAEENLIPSWVKNNAGWWADGTIDDNSFIQGIQFLIDAGVVIVPEIDNLKMENAELQKQNDELLVQLDEGRIIIEDLVLVIEENIIKKTITSAPESTGLSGQYFPDKLWGQVNAEYYDNRYERVNVEIHTSDKYENDFVFEVGQVDVLVWYEEEREDIACAMEGGYASYSKWEPGHPVRFYCSIPDNDGDGNSEYLDIIVPVDVVAIEHTIEFSESDYSYDNKLVYDIEGCLPAEDYFIKATIFSDTGRGFGWSDEFSVDSGSC